MVASIRDATIRRLIEERLRQHGIDPSDAKTPRNIPKAVFAEPLMLPNGNGGPPVQIKKVRIETSEQGLVPFKDSSGKPYRYAMTGDNHHVEFFEWEENGKTLRDAIAVTLFEAAQRKAARKPIVNRTHPTNPAARFMFALSKNDMVMLTGDDGIERLYRVQIISCTGGRADLSFRLHTASGLEDAQTLVRIRSLSPAKFRCRRVDVSPIGDIHASTE